MKGRSLYWYRARGGLSTNKSCHYRASRQSYIYNGKTVFILKQSQGLTSIAIPVLKIRRSRDHPIFNMGIPIPGKDGLYIETKPRMQLYMKYSFPVLYVRDRDQCWCWPLSYSTAWHQEAIRHSRHMFSAFIAWSSIHIQSKLDATIHDNVIKWKHFPRYWPFVRGIHRSPVNSPHKGQWRGALVFPWSAPAQTVE